MYKRKKITVFSVVMTLVVSLTGQGVLAGKTEEKKEMERKIVKAFSDYKRACSQTQNALLKDYREEEGVGKKLENIDLVIVERQASGRQISKKEEKVVVDTGQTIEVSELQPLGNNRFIIQLAKKVPFNKKYRTTAGNIQISGVEGWDNRSTPVELMNTGAVLYQKIKVFLKKKDEYLALSLGARCLNDLEMKVSCYLKNNSLKAACYAMDARNKTKLEKNIETIVGPEGEWKLYIGELHPYSELYFQPHIKAGSDYSSRGLYSGQQRTDFYTSEWVTFTVGRVTIYSWQRSGDTYERSEMLGAFIYKDSLLFDPNSPEVSDDIKAYFQEEKQLKNTLAELLTEAQEKYGQKFMSELKKLLQNR
ncbi:hypothetical protein ACFL27_20655 [candidate division CSSED10-310 bacterium]|uniref:Uncharacterized protein n=1 Tax=candidate division CSSED10-310 bacterium TaxID=2855610 RepID=A0ABV6Z2P0_UNCC1